jgi:hypothetical protein
MVVGVMDDPPGPEGTSTAFLWNGSELRPLPLPPEVVMSTANSITDQLQVGGMLVRVPPDKESEDAESIALESYILGLDAAK